MLGYRPIGAALAISILAGCGLAHEAALRDQSKVLEQRLKSEIAECERLHPDPYRKPVTERVRCKNAAVLRLYEAAQKLDGSGQVDLVQLANARRLVAAERFDRGLTTKAQYDTEIAEIDVAHRTEFLARENNATMSAAAQQQAAAASQQASIARQKAISDAFKPPRSVSCTTYGNITTCN